MAKELGVSTATISRALSAETSHLVREERRQEILELADKMRYRPNPGARLIQRGINPTLNVIIPKEEDIFFSEFYGRLLGGVIRASSDTDWKVQISALNVDSDNVLDEFRRIGLGCSAIFYAGLPLTTEQVDALSYYHSPLVLIRSALPPDYPLEEVDCHVVGVDNYNGGILTVAHLAEQGHERVGLILGPSDFRDFAERAQGYRDGLAQAGLVCDESLVFNGSYDLETGRVGFEKLMKQDNPPTALICANDNIAFGALDSAKEVGFNCPHDVSIIGFDDGPWATACSPRLTTIRQPLSALTGRAFELLLNTAKSKEPVDVRHIELSTVLSVRESTMAI